MRYSSLIVAVDSCILLEKLLVILKEDYYL